MNQNRTMQKKILLKKKEKETKGRRKEGRRREGGREGKHEGREKGSNGSAKFGPVLLNIQKYLELTINFINFNPYGKTLHSVRFS